MKTTMIALLAVAGTATAASAQLYNNATAQGLTGVGLSTGATTGSGVAAPAGFNWSELQNDGAGTANTSAGFSGSGTFRVADNFSITDPNGWQIDNFLFYGYVTGSAPITNPYASWTVRIWNGTPGAATSSIVFGDTTTNRLGTVTNTNLYRIFSTTTPPPGSTQGTTRLIREVQLNTAGLTLGPGNYWVDFGNNTGFLPTLTPVGVRSLAGFNALQFATTWGPAIDTGSPATGPDVAVDFPFQINGQVIPTPGSLALIGVGGLLLAGRRRR